MHTVNLTVYCVFNKSMWKYISICLFQFQEHSACHHQRLHPAYKWRSDKLGWQPQNRPAFPRPKRTVHNSSRSRNVASFLKCKHKKGGGGGGGGTNKNKAASFFSGVQAQKRLQNKTKKQLRQASTTAKWLVIDDGDEVSVVYVFLIVCCMRFLLYVLMGR